MVSAYALDSAPFRLPSRVLPEPPPGNGRAPRRDEAPRCPATPSLPFASGGRSRWAALASALRRGAAGRRPGSESWTAASVGLGQLLEDKGQLDAVVDMALQRAELQMTPTRPGEGLREILDAAW